MNEEMDLVLMWFLGITDLNTLGILRVKHLEVFKRLNNLHELNSWNPGHFLYVKLHIHFTELFLHFLVLVLIMLSNRNIEEFSPANQGTDLFIYY